MTVEITEKTARITKEEVDAVEAIQRNGQIPMKTWRLQNRSKDQFRKYELYP